MDEVLIARYWCHMCSQMVNPVMEVEIKCPHCNSGFVEEMDGGGDLDAEDLGSDRTFSSWASILLGMHRRLQRVEEEEDHRDEVHLRMRRRSAAILQLIQAVRETTRSVSNTSESERERYRERNRDLAILINHYNQAIHLQGSSDTSETLHHNLDLILQHLSENDPNRYGTPPARKEALDAMPTVKIEEAISCSICLEDFGIGEEAMEMPCKHKFHCGCILSWLELHSSCPICRFQMPADESKDLNGGGSSSSGDSGDGGN